MTTITSKTGDTVDLICRRAYGDESGYVEDVLAANPGLAALGVFLPVGTQVTLPVIATISTDAPAVVTLWD